MSLRPHSQTNLCRIADAATILALRELGNQSPERREAIQACEARLVHDALVCDQLRPHRLCEDPEVDA